MDVDDVSDVEQWMQLLKKQKVKLQAARKRNGERPWALESRAQLIRQFMLQLQEDQDLTQQSWVASSYPRSPASYSIKKKVQDANKAKLSQQGDQHIIRQSWDATSYPPAVVSLSRLKKTYISDLCLETHHRGSYVLLRVATPPNTMTAVMTIMSDEKGDGTILQLYQQKNSDNGLGEEVVQKERVCIVKEPYFKILNDGGYGLRVDHLSDVIWLLSDDERIPPGWRTLESKVEKTAEDLKAEGNVAIKAGKLTAAMESYTLALQRSNTSELSDILKLNRSLVNIKLQRYDNALKDIEELTADAQQSEKGLYRAALSLYSLGRFQKSHEVLEHLVSHIPQSDAGKSMLLRTTKRLREQEQGDYDFRAMYEAAKETPPCIDSATFAGNVEVRASKGRGCGLFTTKDVTAGELLLCEKAFSYCSSRRSKTSLLMCLRTDRVILGMQAELITATVQKLFRNPSLRPIFTSLHHGCYRPVDAAEVDGMPIVDTFLVDRIISLNVFGCPRTTLKSHSARMKAKPQDQPKSHHTCGIFIRASFINHSCYSNARRSFIGDMQILRASRDIPAGSEIFLCYAYPEKGHKYEKMQEKLQKWGFQCTCAICQQDQNTMKSVLNRRLFLLKALEYVFECQSAAGLAKAERLLDAIEGTYPAPASDVPRLALWASYLLLTHAYSMGKQHDKVIETAWKLLTSLGFTFKRQNLLSLTSPFEIQQWGLMNDCLIETWVVLWIAYAQVAPELCKKAEGYAKLTYKICIGEDETFDETCGRLARQAISEGKSVNELLRPINQ